MSVLTSLFNFCVVQSCPVMDDIELVFERDKDGNVMSTYKRVDYPKVIERNGNVDLWSLDKLLSAGINPDMSIYTSPSNRLDGRAAIDAVVSEAMPVIESELSNVEKSE